ncbi:hypothetical protein MTO96_049232 [Rhipicephalus appendiculatus]
MAVCQPNGFEKMRVNLAFRFFSDEVLRGLYVYNSQVEHCYGTGCTKATSAFVAMMRDLIDAMTSRYSKRGLRPDSKEVASIKCFLEFLATWQKAVPKQGSGGEASATEREVVVSPGKPGPFSGGGGSSG